VKTAASVTQFAKCILLIRVQLKLQAAQTNKQKLHNSLFSKLV